MARKDWVDLETIRNISKHTWNAFAVFVSAGILRLATELLLDEESDGTQMAIARPPRSSPI